MSKNTATRCIELISAVSRIQHIIIMYMYACMLHTYTMLVNIMISVGSYTSKETTGSDLCTSSPCSCYELLYY